MSVTVTTFINGSAVSPTRTDPPSPSFRDIVLHNAGDNYGWNGSQLTESTRITPMVANDRWSPRFDSDSWKVIVKPGDNPINSTGERNEYLWQTSNGVDENGSSGTLYYGISILLPNEWKDTSSWCIPVQLHGPDNLPSNQATPAFSLDLSTVPQHYTLNQNGGDTANVIRRATDLGTHVYDQWVDFLFEVTWAADNSGFTAAWTRTNKTGLLQQQQVGTGTAITPWNTPTLYSLSGTAYNHYWKRGCYRSAETFTTTFFAGPFSRAATQADAAWAAFGQWP